MLLETILVHPLNSLHLSMSLLLSHSNTQCCLFTWEVQTKDKASVKWDLAATWAELARTVSDIIWKWRLFCTNKRVIKWAGGGQGAVRCVCVCEGEKGTVSVCVFYTPLCVILACLSVRLSTWDKPDGCCYSCLAGLQSQSLLREQYSETQREKRQRHSAHYRLNTIFTATQSHPCHRSHCVQCTHYILHSCSHTRILFDLSFSCIAPYCVEGSIRGSHIANMPK